ncbi:MAG: exodeoxyribonuclease VII small subunit [Arenicellales bacterium]
MPKKTKTTPDNSQLSFETALSELQKVVSRMEDEQQNLDDSIADYEHGMQLVTMCQQQLDAAQLKVEQLVKTRGDQKGDQNFEPLETDNA